LINYYNWSVINLQNDTFIWLDNTISWEDSSFVLNLGIFFFFNILNSSLFNIFFSTRGFSFLSFIDLMTLNSFFGYDFLLINAFFTDLLFSNYSNTPAPANLLGFFYLNPEFLLFISLYNSTLSDFIFSTSVMSTRDFMYFNIFQNYLNTLLFFKWFVIFLFTISVFVYFIKSLRVGLLYNFFFFKFFFFITSLSFENRIRLDLAFIFIFFLLFIWFIVLMTYDDIFIEVIELFHFYLIFIFLLIITFLLLKYSVHYFSFLETSVIDGRSVLFILKQFVRDISNTFALFLRFFLLLFRLNIYDGLDDFLDSYYIFFIDFDEDSFNDEFFFYYFNTFLSDNNEDLVFYQLTEFGWFEDLYSKYFIIWGKFFMFWFFILEEAFRVSLALYIFYLIIFEVHSVNVSYNEVRKY
jgi:hypothetical protein